MQTITETRGQCSAAISHTRSKCSCPEFVPGARGFYDAEAWGFICKRCHHTEGVHRIEAAR